MTLYDQFKEELKNYITCEDIIQISKFNRDPTYIKIITTLLYDLYVELETVSDQTTYRYWRLTSFVMPAGIVQLNELHFYSATNASGTVYPPTMTSDIAPAPYVVTRSYAYSSTYEGWKAFDNNGSTWLWLLSRSAAQQLTDWVQIDLGSEINVKSIKIQYSSGPTSSKLYASNTGAFTGEQVLMHTFSNALTQTVG